MKGFSRPISVIAVRFVQLICMLALLGLASCGGGGGGGGNGSNPGNIDGGDQGQNPPGAQKEVVVLSGTLSDRFPPNITIDIASSDSSEIIAQATTSAGGDWSASIDSTDIADVPALILSAAHPDTQVMLRSVVATSELQGKEEHSSASTIISRYSEAAYILSSIFGASDKPAYLRGQLQERDSQHVSTSNGLLNQLATEIDSFQIAGLPVQSAEYWVAIYLEYLASSWPDVVSTAEASVISLPTEGELAGFQLVVKQFEGLDNVTVEDNALILVGDNPGVANTKIEIKTPNSEFIHREYASLVREVEKLAEADVNRSQPLSINAGTLDLVANSESFEYDGQISISKISDGSNPNSIEAFKIDSSVQPDGFVELRWKVPEDVSVDQLTLVHINPESKEESYVRHVSYDPDTKIAVFRLSGFSVVEFVKSLFIHNEQQDVEEVEYTIGTVFDKSELLENPQSVLKYVKSQVDYLLDKNNLKDIQSCPGEDADKLTIDHICIQYFSQLGSKSLASFARIRLDTNDVVDLGKVNVPFFLSNKNATDLYNELKLGIKASPSLIGTPFHPYVEFSNATLTESMDFGVFGYSPHYYFPMMSYRLAEMARAESAAGIFSDVIARFSNDASYGSAKALACAAASEAVERAIVGLLASSPKVPDVAESMIDQYRELGKEIYLYAFEYQDNAFKREVDSYIGGVLLNGIPGFDIYNGVSTVSANLNEFFDYSKYLLSIAAANYKFVQLQPNGQCINDRCLGSNEKKPWRSIDFLGVNYYFPPEVDAAYTVLSGHKATFDACNFEPKVESHPGEIDETGSNSNSGYPTDEDTNSPQIEPVNIKADISISGTLRPGEQITLSASNTTVSPSESPVTYQWELFGPNGSNARLSDGVSEETSFVPDGYGAYTVKLSAYFKGITSSVASTFSVVEEIAGRDLTNSDPQFILGSQKYGVSGNKGESKVWEIEVDSDVTRIYALLLRESSRDDGLGIAIRRGSEPSVSCVGQACDWNRFDAAGDPGGRYESVEINDPEPGKYFLKAYAFGDFDSAQIYYELRRDSDKDNDGVPNSVDWAPLDDAEQYDSDGDGVGDAADAFPNDRAASVDDDDDGLPDAWNTGADSSTSSTGLTLDPSPGVRTIIQDAGIVSVDGLTYVLILAEESSGAELVSSPLHATIEKQGDRWVLNPNDDFEGSDSFVYQVSSASDGLRQVVVTYDVLAQDDLPDEGGSDGDELEVENLILYLPLNGDADDRSGNTESVIGIHNLSYVNGVSGQAAEFNGASSYIDIDDSLIDVTGGWSFAAWVQGSGHILSNNNGGKGRFTLEIRNRTLRAFLGGNGECNPSTEDCLLIEADNDIDPNQWVHVALSISQGEWRLYLNGELVGEDFIAFDPDTTKPLNIGADGMSTSFRYFSGLIDELRIYESALSSDQINTIYDATFGGGSKGGGSTGGGSTGGGSTGGGSTDGGSSDGGTTDGGSTDGGGAGDSTGGGLAQGSNSCENSVSKLSDIQGEWRAACGEWYDGRPMEHVLTFDGTSFIEEHYYYETSDDLCESGVSEVLEFEAQASLGKTYVDESGLSYTELNLDYVEGGTQFYDIVSLARNNLILGDLSTGDSSSSDQRPTRLRVDKLFRPVVDNCRGDGDEYIEITGSAGGINVEISETDFEVVVDINLGEGNGEELILRSYDSAQPFEFDPEYINPSSKGVYVIGEGSESGFLENVEIQTYQYEVRAYEGYIEILEAGEYLEGEFSFTKFSTSGRFDEDSFQGFVEGNISGSFSIRNPNF